MTTRDDKLQALVAEMREEIKSKGMPILCDASTMEWADKLQAILSTPEWKCKANPTADPPQDCDWPTCGCDPYADKVIEALHISTPEPVQEKHGETVCEHMNNPMTCRDCRRINRAWDDLGTELNRMGDEEPGW